MPRIPRDKSLDSTLALLSDPHRFISTRCRRYQSDLFETRLLLQRTICMTGAGSGPPLLRREPLLPPGRCAKGGSKDVIQGSMTQSIAIANNWSCR